MPASGKIHRLQLSNAELFARYARPGMLGLIGAQAPQRPMPSLIRAVSGCALDMETPSAWSHAFLVLEREERNDGQLRVLLVESTLVTRAERLPRCKDSPGHPRWNGPQTAVLVRRRAGGELGGQFCRKPARRYVDETYTPNAALLDLGLSGEQWKRARKRALDILHDDSVHYAAVGLVGTFLAVVTGQLDDPNPLDHHDLFCTAFVRAVLDPIYPPFRELPVHKTNTFPEHLYQAALGAGAEAWEVVRSTDIPEGHRLLAEAACALVPRDEQERRELLARGPGQSGELPPWVA